MGKVNLGQGLSFKNAGVSGSKFAKISEICRGGGLFLSKKVVGYIISPSFLKKLSLQQASRKSNGGPRKIS